MVFKLSNEEGEYLVLLARRAIESQLRSGRVVVPGDASEHLKTECGVFVTLNVVKGDRRQCCPEGPQVSRCDI